jgi:cytochrome c biogenesis protein CcmG/thiol:disulfide interchange protein DsbE
MKGRLRFVIPLALLGVMSVFLFVGLGRDPREVPSPLIGKPAPGFTLARLDSDTATFSPAELKGKVWLLNVWASWCVACREEHPLLVDLAKAGVLPIYGLNYKDEPEAARAWLARYGNPYVASVIDRDGRIGIDYGVYGVPETFLIDGEGVVRYKRIGPLRGEHVEKHILPLLRATGALPAGK